MKGKILAAGGAALLMLSGCATGPGNQRATLLVTMNGIQEVPGPGDPDGSGTVELRVVPGSGQVCWNLYARGIAAATAAHVHRGAAGSAGPVVVPLTTPDAAGRSQGCATVDPGLTRELTLRASEFYVNVHDAPHPAGAIRGQLRGGPRRSERLERAGQR
jgi:CHRD domain